ncbi:PAS domain-containing protein [Marinobacter sp. SBS5]|uniref:PAS domain-containing protein n=1 Tax=Marinobacter sp. SBS5 TaxID=3401754 RepID=UPI003AAFF80D
MNDTQESPYAKHHDRLRRCARDLIQHGVAPRHHGSNLSVDALQLLYERASNPESASDALKLLHELQTYQVELDLLYEQLQANEYEINEELAHYRSLYEQAPAAYLILANDGEIIEGNVAAATLFGEPSMALTGIGLWTFLAAGQKDAVDTLLKNAKASTSRKPIVTTGSLELSDHRLLSVQASGAATGDSTLIILTETTTHSTTV